MEETIRSVLLQGYPDLEYIVMDGGSTDNSVNIIRKYEPWITYWKSERDEGQADAINQGAELVTGEIFNWVNSDDYLQPSALEAIGSRCPSDGAIAFAQRSFGLGQDEIARNKNLDFRSIVSVGGKAVFRQPALWITRAVMSQCFPLSREFHYAFDWEMLARIAAGKAQIEYDDFVVTNFRLHQASKTVALSERWHDEEIAILTRLASDPRFHEFHQVCLANLQKMKWHAIVNRIRTTHTSGLRNVVRILAAAMSAPFERMDRHTLGAIRRELLR